MTLEESLLDLCLDAYEARMETNAHLPEDERVREARAAARRVLKSLAPGAVVWIEKNRDPVDQLAARRHSDRVRRLRDRARPLIEAIAAQASASTGGDVSGELLTGKCSYPWLRPWRDQLCWDLSRAGMRTREIAQVLDGHNHGAVGRAIKRHEIRQRAAGAAKGERAHGA